MIKYEQPKDSVTAALILRNLRLILDRIDRTLINLDDWIITVDGWFLGLNKGDYRIHVVIEETCISIGVFNNGELENELEYLEYGVDSDNPFYCQLAHLMMLASE